MRRPLLAAAAALLGIGAAPAPAGGPQPVEETTTSIFHRPLPNVPGKALIAAEVLYPAGGATPPHKHPKSAFVFAYVLEGKIASAVGDEAPRIYGPGESWYEEPGAVHRVSRNASDSEPAKLLAIFIVDPGEGQLKFPAR